MESHTIDIDLPDDAVVQHAILVVSYFDADGATRYAFKMSGEGTIDGTVGLLEIAKAHLMSGMEF